MILKDSAYAEVDRTIYEMWLLVVNLNYRIEMMADEEITIGLADIPGIKERLQKLVDPLEKELKDLLMDTLLPSDDIDYTPNLN